MTDSFTMNAATVTSTNFPSSSTQSFDDGLFITTTTIHAILCIVSITLYIFAVWKHFLASTLMLKRFNKISILCMTTWTVSNILWMTNFYTTFSSFDDWKINFYTELGATYLSSFGYYLFIILFGMRIINAFKDSIFEISQKKQKVIRMAAILSATLLFVSFTMVIFLIILYYTNILYADDIADLAISRHIFIVSTLLLAIDLVGYIIVSIILVKLMIGKMYQVHSFINSNKLSSTVDSDSMSVTCTAANAVQTSMIEIINRLTVLYTISLFSTMIFVIYLIILMCILAVYGEYRSEIFPYAMYYFFRIAAISDVIVNSCCLLLQNETGKHLYHKFCTVCDRCLG